MKLKFYRTAIKNNTHGRVSQSDSPCFFTWVIMLLYAYLWHALPYSLIAPRPELSLLSRGLNEKRVLPAHCRLCGLVGGVGWRKCGGMEAKKCSGLVFLHSNLYYLCV